MTTYRFDWLGEHVLRLLAHSKRSKERLPTYAQRRLKRVPAGLWFVKDEGVYLLSNGKLEEGRTPETDGLVAYAEGYGKGIHVPGDDFVEFIPAKDLAQLTPTRTFTIVLHVSHMELFVRDRQ